MNGSRIARFAALAVVAAFTSRPASAQRPNEAAIRSALNAEMAKFAQALKAKDAAGVANMFTEDGTWIMPDASSFTGRSAIASAAANQFQTFESFVVDRITIDRLVVVSDSMALTFSHGDYTLTVKDKAPAKRINPVADLWKKGTDGTWRVSYELNADGPAPIEVGTAR